jgi:hypothetical protein
VVGDLGRASDDAHRNSEDGIMEQERTCSRLWPSFTHLGLPSLPKTQGRRHNFLSSEVKTTATAATTTTMMMIIIMIHRQDPQYFMTNYLKLPERWQKCVDAIVLRSNCLKAISFVSFEY